MAYELGAKTTWGDGRARLNGSVFYYDYDNFQAFFFADTTSRLIDSKAEFWGGEAELIFSPGDGWDILVGVSVLDTTVNGTSPDGGKYTLLDAKLTYISPGDDWEASVFVNNLTDERSLTYSYDITGFGFYTIQVFGPPRWFGATLRYRFN